MLDHAEGHNTGDTSLCVGPSTRLRHMFQVPSSNGRSVFVLAATTLWVVTFLLYLDAPDWQTGMLLIPPAVMAGWKLGSRMGLLIGLLFIPVRLLFSALHGPVDWDSALNGTCLLGMAAVMLTGLIAGHLHEINVWAQIATSQRSRSEDTLHQKEQLLKLLCERAQLGYQTLTSSGHVVDVSPAWLAMTGYAREEVTDRWFGDFLAPNYQELFSEYLSQLRNLGEIRDGAFEMVRKDGTRLPITFDAQVDFNGCGTFQRADCIISDGVEHKQVAEALRAERDRAQQYLDIAGVILVVINTDQTIALINRKGCEILGSRPEKLVGQNWFDRVVPARVVEEVRQLFEALMSGDIEGDEYFEHPVITQTGEERLIAWHNTILTDTSGHVVGILGSGEDITERRQMEENLRRAHEELELRVHERTGDLSRANELLQQEIVERERAEAAEKEQRVLAEALRDTASALNSTLNFEEVLDQILANLERVVQHPTGNIMLVQDGWARIVRWRGYNGYVSDQVMQSVRLSIARPSHLRWMAETGQPLIIQDVDQYQRWVKLESSAWVRSYAGAPIRTGEQVIGFINLDSAEPCHFKTFHAEGLRAFVDQAAIAIENARLYSQAQELAAVEERSRIAHDLHDAVSQTLWSACLIADGLPAVWDKDPSEGRRNLDTLRQMTRGALAEMRALLLELRPAALAEVDLGELLRQLTQAFTGRTRIPVALIITERRMLPPEVQATLYRITQEALNNIARHAAASQVAVYLCHEPGRVELRVCDNGIGFKLDEVAPGHLGIGIMRERAESIGASLKIDSQVGRGTTVEASWEESECL
jgi:PAS domain S-box-containing protein